MEPGETNYKDVRVGVVVNIADWADTELQSLAPHDPEKTNSWFFSSPTPASFHECVGERSFSQGDNLFKEHLVCSRLEPLLFEKVRLAQSCRLQ